MRHRSTKTRNCYMRVCVPQMILPIRFMVSIRKQRLLRGQSYSPRKRKGGEPKEKTPAKK